MLFKQRFWPGLADGTITLAFRRWKRPTVKAGGTLTSPGGVLGIDEVVIIEPDEITAEQAQAAGYRTAEDVLADLRPSGRSLPGPVPSDRRRSEGGAAASG